MAAAKRSPDAAKPLRKVRGHAEAIAGRKQYAALHCLAAERARVGGIGKRWECGHAAARKPIAAWDQIVVIIMRAFGTTAGQVR
ncbi:MAG: hypothetical protein ABSG03_12105 [Bryobacteraceae bacterium]|jgi:hypothetical protein